MSQLLLELFVCVLALAIGGAFIAGMKVGNS